MPAITLDSIAKQAKEIEKENENLEVQCVFLDHESLREVFFGQSGILIDEPIEEVGTANFLMLPIPSRLIRENEQVVVIVTKPKV